jgi:hypothetical protein
VLVCIGVVDVNVDEPETGSTGTPLPGTYQAARALN